MNTDTKHTRENKNRIAIADIISAVILLLLIYAAISKLLDYYAFVVVLERSPFLKPFAGVIGWLLPVSEIIVSIFLFMPRQRLRGLYASASLISIFTIYLSYMVLFTPDLPCGCGGILQSLTWGQHIFFNLFFILLSAAAIFIYKKYKIATSRSPP